MTKELKSKQQPEESESHEDGLGDGAVEMHHRCPPSFVRLNFFSCHRKFILFGVFLVMELMFRSHLRFWDMMVSRKQKDPEVKSGVSWSEHL